MEAGHFDEKYVRSRMQGPAIFLLVLAFLNVLWFGLAAIYGCLNTALYGLLFTSQPMGSGGDDLAMMFGLVGALGCSTVGNALLALASAGVAWAAAHVLGQPTRRTVLVASLGAVLLPVLGTLTTVFVCSVCGCIGGPMMTLVAVVPAIWLFSLSQDPDTAQWLTRLEPEPDPRG